MKMQTIWITSVLPLTVFTMGVRPCSAALLKYDDRGSFAAEGTIFEEYGFDEEHTVGYHGIRDIPEPYTAHGVTYTCTDNLLVGYDPWVGSPLSIMLINNKWTPITADISASSVTMLGFGLAYLGLTDDVHITIYTNVDSYQLLNQTVPNAAEDKRFFGFVTESDDEYITGFRVDRAPAHGTPAIDDITLGYRSTPIPEPTSFVMFAGLGVMGLIAARRRKRAA